MLARDSSSSTAWQGIANGMRITPFGGPPCATKGVKGGARERAYARVRGSVHRVQEMQPHEEFQVVSTANGLLLETGEVLTSKMSALIPPVTALKKRFP